ncbi:hypothetical protein IMZ48_07360 [Candidatus Bathyarchaeota archaeon]|nr:hypothetical protein [Candidatus Bathyarchaeota archaeon]
MATPRKAAAPRKKKEAAATPRKVAATKIVQKTTTPAAATTKGQKTPGTDSPYRIKDPVLLSRVREGRIKKVDTPRRKADVNSSLLDEGSSKLDDDETVTEADRHEAMMRERKLFPANESWAPDEERLFELLFMRQYSPLMPQDWETDFRGIPLPDILFRTSEVHKPVVYSHLDWHFRGE